jgi:hypothetical protein
MKFIITESQYNKTWILRRYQLVKNAFNETISWVGNSTLSDPCRFGSFSEFEKIFYQIMMDELHPHFYDNDNFDYEGVMAELADLFYVDLTEYYHNLDC